MGQKWIVGKIVRQMREDEGLSLEQLSRGLCSVSTLSRMEANEREMDLLLASRIFQRLGYTVDKYELYAYPNELKQWDERYTLEQLAKNRNTEKLKEALDQYAKNYGRKGTKLCPQSQYINYMRGILLIQQQKWNEAVSVLECVAFEAIPNWKSDDISQEALGKLEIELLDTLGDLFESLGNGEESYTIREKLIKNIDRTEKRQRLYINYYASLICKNGQANLERKGPERMLKSIKTVLNIMKSEKCICFWPQILELQAVCLEQVSKQEKREILKKWQEAYYIYLLYEQREKAQKIRKYIKEEYQWECMM